VARAPKADPNDVLSWVPAEDGYSLALDGAKLVCRNPKGKTLASVPASVKKGEVAEELLALRDWLVAHEQMCREQVEDWMLRSLTVPRPLLVAVWADPAWRGVLSGLVVGTQGLGKQGFLTGVDVSRGIGVVDLEGETRWLDAAALVVPHPILLSDLEDWRELAGDLELSQKVHQLYRETYAMTKDVDAKATKVGEYEGGRFQALTHALSKAKALGYRVRGGYAICPVWRDGVITEARYWIGAEYPEAETHTGELLWVDDQEQALPLTKVNAVAYSEGVRMAAQIYAARAVEKQADAS
jgi:hypothetical protein